MIPRKNQAPKKGKRNWRNPLSLRLLQLAATESRSPLQERGGERRSTGSLDGRKSFVNMPRTYGLILLSFLLLFSVSSLRAQDKKADAQLRTVHGSVVGGDENPVASAVVYLVNVKTQAVKTYIADESGNYRFSGLDPNSDYELHAEHDEWMSATHTVSSFNSSRDIEVTLKLSHKKKP